RLRTTLLHRLFCILAMDDSPEKVRAMRGFLRWADSALDVANGWMGTVKPDFLGYHHRGVYANAYAPHAFHNGALVYYLLRDTPFALSDTVRENLRQTLLTARLIANKYEVPVSISGRMPFHPGVLNRILPGFAYMALSGDPMDREMAAAFMRLWDPSCEPIRDELIPKAAAGIMYLDTLGSLQAMVELSKSRVAPEAAPSGHWSKPYGALAIHRRDEWMVSVKGWSKYVWNYEGHADENVFGRYHSHGAIQVLARGTPVTASESGYAEEGWDWSRWPGTTAINLPLKVLGATPKESARRFSDETFVGGVSLEGRDGAFAMKLHDTVHDTSFRAIKSVFCFEDTIVCLGSNIRNDDASHRTETTLFQCRLPASDAAVWVSSAKPVTAFPFESTFDDGETVWLMDSVGNGYYAPNARGLRVARRRQQSIRDVGKGETEGDFAVAWIDHGAAPKDDGYEYAMLIQSTPDAVARFAKDPTYQVLRRDETSHIVRDR
ncbi:unnamed protein product, partial [marine sediment metagenome]